MEIISEIITIEEKPIDDPSTIRGKIQRIVGYFGYKNMTDLANGVGVTKSAISMWIKRGKIPDERIKQLDPNNETGLLIINNGEDISL